jgi:hypothetical protein
VAGLYGAARLSVRRLSVRRLSVRRETGYCHSGTARTGTYAVDAPFMLLERDAAWLSALPDVLKPDIQCVRTYWNRGFIAFQLAGCTQGRVDGDSRGDGNSG